MWGRRKREDEYRILPDQSASMTFAWDPQRGWYRPAWTAQPGLIGQIRFGSRELRDIFLGIIALTFAFAIAMTRGLAALPGISAQAFAIHLGIAFLAVATGFLLHELAHKFLAQRYGCWAEFRANYQGLVFALLFSFAGFLFAAPGAVVIAGPVSREQSGRLSLAGPGTNLLIALVALPFVLVGPGESAVMASAVNAIYFVNAFLAIFNLIPVPPLDGSKVWAWSRPALAGAMALGIGLLALRYLL